MKNILRYFVIIAISLFSRYATSAEEHAVKRTETNSEITYSDGIATATYNKHTRNFAASMHTFYPFNNAYVKLTSEASKKKFKELKDAYLRQQEITEHGPVRDPEEVEDSNVLKEEVEWEDCNLQ